MAGRKMDILTEDLRDQLISLKDEGRDLANELTNVYPQVQGFIHQLHPVSGAEDIKTRFQSALKTFQDEVGGLKHDSLTFQQMLDQDHIARSKKTETTPQLINVQVPKAPAIDFSPLMAAFNAVALMAMNPQAA